MAEGSGPGLRFSVGRLTQGKGHLPGGDGGSFTGQKVYCVPLQGCLYSYKVVARVFKHLKRGAFRAAVRSYGGSE